MVIKNAAKMETRDLEQVTTFLRDLDRDTLPLITDSAGTSELIERPKTQLSQHTGQCFC